MNKKNKNKGFSLIELIIAIAILVILTGLLAPQFMKYIEKSREAKDIQAMDTVYSSVQAALGNEGAYDEIATVAKDEKVYVVSLENVLKPTTGIENFGVELKNLLGNVENIGLVSKRARGDDGNNGIFIAIKYTKGPNVEVGSDSDKKTIETFGGYEVMVFCSPDGKSTVAGFNTVGANLTVTGAEEIK